MGTNLHILEKEREHASELLVQAMQIQNGFEDALSNADVLGMTSSFFDALNMTFSLIPDTVSDPELKIAYSEMALSIKMSVAQKIAAIRQQV